jgi:hypothetical protein
VCNCRILYFGFVDSSMFWLLGGSVGGQASSRRVEQNLDVCILHIFNVTCVVCTCVFRRFDVDLVKRVWVSPTMWVWSYYVHIVVLPVFWDDYFVVLCSYCCFTTILRWLFCSVMLQVFCLVWNCTSIILRLSFCSNVNSSLQKWKSKVCNCRILYFGFVDSSMFWLLGGL